MRYVKNILCDKLIGEEIDEQMERQREISTLSSNVIVRACQGNVLMIIISVLSTHPSEKCGEFAFTRHARFRLLVHDPRTDDTYRRVISSTVYTLHLLVCHRFNQLWA